MDAGSGSIDAEALPAARVRGAVVVGRSSLRRMAFLASLFGLAGGFTAYMVTQVPVRNLAESPVLLRGITFHWSIAVVGLAVVVAVDALAVALIVRSRRARLATDRASLSGAAGVPSPLRMGGVPRWALVTTGIVSGGGLVFALALDLPLWQRALFSLIPWVPVFVLNEVWRYRHFGFYAVFVGLAVLQVGHLGEHSTQVLQLLVSDGDLARSHGVFGQLDFEGVHFVWDTAVWLGGAVLISRFWVNKWLWLSWLVASVHQVEHIYLFWVNRFHVDFWAHGGVFGIFGQGGLVGSPMPRPYLHFAYNFLVVVPMVIALWDEGRRLAARGVERP